MDSSDHLCLDMLSKVLENTTGRGFIHDRLAIMVNLKAWSQDILPIYQKTLNKQEKKNDAISPSRILDRVYGRVLVRVQTR